MHLFLGHTEVRSNLQPHYNPIKRNSLQHQRQTHVVVLETQVDCLQQDSVTFVPLDGHAPSFGTRMSVNKTLQHHLESRKVSLVRPGTWMVVLLKWVSVDSPASSHSAMASAPGCFILFTTPDGNCAAVASTVCSKRLKSRPDVLCLNLWGNDVQA